ncbi:hypothetical protein ACR6C2_36325 [Streptomyces sp. INA 01156]
MGTYYVSHVLRGSTATYGMFGIVLGLLAWLYAGHSSSSRLPRSEPSGC